MFELTKPFLIQSVHLCEQAPHYRRDSRNPLCRSSLLRPHLPWSRIQRLSMGAVHRQRRLGCCIHVCLHFRLPTNIRWMEVTDRFER